MLAPSYLFFSAKARRGGHKKQHAVDTLVLSLGPNSTRSGIIRADENKMVTGPNLNSRLESLPRDRNSHHAPAATNDICRMREDLSNLALCSAIPLSG